jgi:hypothetical protein
MTINTIGGKYTFTVKDAYGSEAPRVMFESRGDDLPILQGVSFSFISRRALMRIKPERSPAF